jgi:uncharacterized membrane protein
MNLLIHLHPSIVHFPIALLLLGSVVALAHLYGSHLYGFAKAVAWIDLRKTAWFLLGLGWLATLPAILSGLLAQSGLPPDAPYRQTLNWHTGTAIALALLYGLLLYRAWLFQGVKARKARAKTSSSLGAGETADLLDYQPARLWLTLALLAGMALIVATGFNGGQLVYEWAVNVNG